MSQGAFKPKVPNRNTICVYCKNEDHTVTECPKFAKKNVQTRRGMAQTRHWCYVCLGRHTTRECTLKQSQCKYCPNKFTHHPLLCLKNPSNYHAAGNGSDQRSDNRAAAPRPDRGCRSTTEKEGSGRFSTDRAKKRKFNDSLEDGMSNFNNLDAPAEQNRQYNCYGLNKDFLEALNIQLPLKNSIFIMNLDFKVDENKVREVFSLAGEICSLKLLTNNDGASTGLCSITYDHPVEAVQAISMFHGKLLYGRNMLVKIDRKANMRGEFVLPEGLEEVGPGLSFGGRPLRHVFYNINKQMEQEEAEERAYNEGREMSDLAEGIKVLTAQQNALLNMPAVWSGNQMPMSMPIQNMSMPIQNMSMLNRNMNIPNQNMNMSDQNMTLSNQHMFMTDQNMSMPNRNMSMQNRSGISNAAVNTANPAIMVPNTIVEKQTVSTGFAAQSTSTNTGGGDLSYLSGMNAQTLLALVNVQNQMQQQGMSLADLPKLLAALQGNAGDLNTDKNSSVNHHFDNNSVSERPHEHVAYRDPNEERHLTDRSSGYKVTVRNLPPGISKQALHEKFSEVGRVMCIGTTGLTSAIVSYSSDYDREKAIRMYDGVRVQGYPIEVNYY